MQKVRPGKIDLISFGNWYANLNSFDTNPLRRNTSGMFFPLDGRSFQTVQYLNLFLPGSNLLSVIYPPVPRIPCGRSLKRRYHNTSFLNSDLYLHASTAFVVKHGILHTALFKKAQ